MALVPLYAQIFGGSVPNYITAIKSWRVGIYQLVWYARLFEFDLRHLVDILANFGS